MSNELILLVFLIIDLALVLQAARMGKEWVIMLIATNLLLCQVTSIKIIDFFGVSVSGATVFYSAIFLATDILSEHWGKQVAKRSVWLAFAAVIVFVVFCYMTRFLMPMEDSKITDAFDVLFGLTPRITFASMIAYVVSQNIDIWLYHWLHRHTNGKHLWLRNNGSTLISQFVDSTLFFGIAFVGLVPSVMSLIITGYLAKLAVALFDTPFIYLSYRFKVNGKSSPNQSAIMQAPECLPT
ncbi:MAG: queuosine precursor transporter [Gammaproteobacteria bacterium]|nr:queuosine precursor transporter [Gammaproteobacteria bacterium]